MPASHLTLVLPLDKGRRPELGEETGARRGDRVSFRCGSFQAALACCWVLEEDVVRESGRVQISARLYGNSTASSKPRGSFRSPTLVKVPVDGSKSSASLSSVATSLTFLLPIPPAISTSPASGPVARKVAL
jgi:hypothetical protein